MRKPKRLPEADLEPYLWRLPESYHRLWGQPEAPVAAPRINWPVLYGNGNPVEIEIGFGKGLFLTNSGITHPMTNFFGIEIIKKYQLLAATRIALRKLPNVKTCCGDAKLVLRDFVEPQSVRTVHIFFPDPWWKARHKRRTLVTREFLDIVLVVLESGGQLNFATDVSEYFEMVTALLAEITGFQKLEQPRENAPVHDMDYLTNFERKFRKEGRPIYRSRYAKL